MLDCFRTVFPTIGDGYLVREKDYQQVEGTLKELLTRSRRVVGKRLVVADGSIVIAYHASRNRTAPVAPFRAMIYQSSAM